MTGEQIDLRGQVGQNDGWKMRQQKYMIQNATVPAHGHVGDALKYLRVRLCERHPVAT
jgi:hypothetical protein